MPRQPRFVVPDLPVHVVHRGNNRIACFRGESDFLVYLALLMQLVPKMRCALHAYCLMTNHVHLLLTPTSPSACSALMGGVAQRYSVYFNRKHGRTGSLWEGRYRSCVVESQRYVLACYRYIEMNPVRAGMVSHPGAYSWSSYAANSGARQDPMIIAHPELLAIGPAQYTRLFMQSLEAESLRDIRDATSGGYPLGTAAFKTSLQLPPGRKVARTLPGPKKSPEGSPEKSVPGTDLFSGGGAF